MEIIENKQDVKYAGFWIRFVAYLLDYLILSAAVSIFILPAAGALGFSIALPYMNDHDPENVLFALPAILSFIAYCSLISVALYWLYFAFFTSSKHQATPGKMAVGIIVVDHNFHRISFARATGRYFSKILSGMIMSIGYIIAAFTDRKQALHDFIAATYVIYKK